MTDSSGFHEDYGQRNDVNVGSERTFGIVFAVVFVLIGAFPLIGGHAPRLWALGVGVIFLIAAFAFSAALRPLNIMWYRFGMLLHKIVNPLVMGVLFFITVTPIALIMRLVGKDPLNRQFDPNVSSYWVEREPGDLQPETMRRQF